MSYQAIGRGSAANDGTGDDLRTGAGKVNANFVELYTKLGDGSSLHALTFPNVTDTVVTLAETQTLTSKTLTDPAVDGTTGIQATSNLLLAPGSQVVEVRGGGSNSGAVKFNCESNSHGQTVIGQPHSAAVTNTLTLPAGSNQEIVGTLAAQTLSSKTISLTNNTVSGTVSEFNTALTGDSFATLAGTQTLADTTVTGYYKLADWKTLIAASTDFADFKSRVAAL